MRRLSLGSFLKARKSAPPFVRIPVHWLLNSADDSADDGGVGERVVGHYVDRARWAGEGIIPHILAHTWAIGTNGNLVSAQGGSRPNTGYHEQLWGAKLYARQVNKPGAENRQGSSGKWFVSLTEPADKMTSFLVEIVYSAPAVLTKTPVAVL